MLAGFGLSIRYTLSSLRPTPQRLRRLVAAFAGWGYTEVYVDWCDSFPWAIDKRFHGSDPYGEELVAGLAREARGRGCTLASVFPAPDALGFIARVESYRRLFRVESGQPVLALDSSAGRSFYAELIDDFLSLLPDAGTILIDCRPSAVAPALLAQTVRPFREQGLRLAACYCGPAGRTAEDLRHLFDGFDLVALPFADAEAHARIYPGRVIPSLSLATQAERDAVPEAVPSGGPGREPPILLWFQPQRGAGSRRAEGGVLAESIEGELPAVRLAAERLGPVPESSLQGAGSMRDETIADEEIVVLDRRLGEALSEGWRWVRLARETLNDAHRAGTTSEMLESLAAAYREALGLSRQLRSRLVEIVDSQRLERAFGTLFGALYEEHLALCGRAGHAVAVEPPDKGDVRRRLETD